MIISMIAAVAENRVIGKDNDLVWNLPDDMKYFVEKTKARHVIMGRKNYESIPPKFRPLPNRPNIVLTRQNNFQADGCVILKNLEEAIELARKNGETEAFIIGGAQIYKLGLAIADKMYITEVHARFDGDTYFPTFDNSEWHETTREHHPKDENHDYSFDFVTYERVNK